MFPTPPTTPSKRRNSDVVVLKKSKKKRKTKRVVYKVQKVSKKAKRKFKKRQQKFVAYKTEFQTRGFVQNQEAFGSLTDVDCVYVGHTTFDMNLYAKVIAHAIIRKLLNKAQIFPVSTDINLNLNGGVVGGANESRGHLLQLNVLGVNSVISGTTFQFPTTQDISMSDLVNGLGLEDKIKKMMFNIGLLVGTGENLLEGGLAEFMDIALYSEDTGTSPLRKQRMSYINFREEKIDIFCRSELVLQNRTRGATSADVDSTAVDNQALQGYMYEGPGVPQTKLAGDPINNIIFDLNRVTRTGLILDQANGNVTPPKAAMHPSFREPPIPKMLVNCKRSKPLLVQSGDYGRFYMYSTFKGTFHNIICKALSARGFDPSVASTNHTWRQFIRAPGQYQFFALEEVLNSGSTNKIDIAWQVQRTVGAILTTTKKRVIMAPTKDVLTTIVDPLIA